MAKEKCVSTPCCRLWCLQACDWLQGRQNLVLIKGINSKLAPLALRLSISSCITAHPIAFRPVTVRPGSWIEETLFDVGMSIYVSVARFFSHQKL